jgi:hypothetical protein
MRPQPAIVSSSGICPDENLWFRQKRSNILRWFFQKALPGRSGKALDPDRAFSAGESLESFNDPVSQVRLSSDRSVSNGVPATKG